MTTVFDIYNAIDALAPFSLTMDFDNTGILVGNRAQTVTKALLALDCTQPVLQQAAALGAELILTHHPVIFHPLKRICADSVVYQLLQKGLAVISAHTNLDIAAGGVNDLLASRLGLQNLSGIGMVSQKPYQKVVAFVPAKQAGFVREAMAKAGAGSIGQYQGCAFSADGTGTFLPLEGSHPAVGSVGTQEQVAETRIEMICPPGKTSAVLQAMKAVHPYEVPAYDVFDDSGLMDTQYVGRIGELSREMSPAEFARFVKQSLNAVSVKYADAGKPICRVAVCSGSGGSFFPDAVSAGADALVTGDVKHDQFLDACSQGLTLLDAGHFDTENLVLEPLRDRLAALLPEVEFLTTNHSWIHAV